MTKKEKLSEIIVAAGIVAFAVYKYSKMSQQEKESVHEDLRFMGEKLVKELLPAQIKGFLPEHWK